MFAVIGFSFCSTAAEQDFVSPDIRKAFETAEIDLPYGRITNILEEYILKEVDPKARLITGEEAAALEEDRATVEKPEEWPRGILYIKCSSLNSGSYAALKGALASQTNAAANGLILDLRGAGGWNADEAEKVASMFLPEGTPLCRIVTGKGRHSATLKARGGDVWTNTSMTVLLIDSETDGTAEMLSGALSGRNGIILMGKSTSGAACLRAPVPMESGRSLFIATGWADWGLGIRRPVVPDISVEPDGKEDVPMPQKNGRQSSDLMELLRITADDELARRASDLILSQARIGKRTVHAGEDTAAK